MEDLDVIIFYEHVARELDVACAIKAIAEQHYGLRVEFEHWPSGLSRALRRFRRPRVVVMPGAITMETWDAILYDWRKSVYFNLAWEQLLSRGTVKRKMPRDEFVLKHVIHHAWSDRWADSLKAIGVPEKNIFINGNPAYKLYESPYNRFFKVRADLAEQYALDADKKWIFFPENFGYAFTPDHQVRTDWLERGISLEEANTMKRLARMTLEETMKWCASIARGHDVELIIRPRPAVPFDDFKNAVQEIIGEIPARLHIIKEESIREWIMASDVVISFYSTSLIEASLAGKISRMLEPYPMPELLHVDWHQHADRVTSSEQLRRVCLDYEAPSNGNKLGAWARSSMLAHGDPIRNIAEFLAKIHRGEVQTPPFSPRRLITEAEEVDLRGSAFPERLLRRAFFSLPKWFLFEYRRVRFKKGRWNTPALILKIHEKDLLSDEEIQQRAKKWKGCLNHIPAGAGQAVQIQNGGSLGGNAATSGNGLFNGRPSTESPRNRR